MSYNCSNTCGCDKQYKAECVFYNGSNLDCTGITKGDDLETILSALDEAICDLQAPSAITTIVNSCSSDIAVTSSSSGSVNTYTVCLNTDITDQITSNSSDILTLQSCVSSGVLDITSSSISITESSTDDCGRILNIELAPPSGLSTYNGIINNDTTAATLPNGSGGAQVVKYFDWNYVANNALTNKDEIYFKVRGKIKGGGAAGTDSIKISVYDLNSSTEVFVVNPPYSSFNTAGISSYTIEADIDVTDIDAGEGLITVKMRTNGVDIATNGGDRYQEIEVCGDFTGLDFSNVRIRVIQVNDSGKAASDDNWCQQLKVGVTKYIGS